MSEKSEKIIFDFKPKTYHSFRIKDNQAFSENVENFLQISQMNTSRSKENSPQTEELLSVELNGKTVSDEVLYELGYAIQDKVDDSLNCDNDTYNENLKNHITTDLKDSPSKNQINECSVNLTKIDAQPLQIYSAVDIFFEKRNSGEVSETLSRKSYKKRRKRVHNTGSSIKIDVICDVMSDLKVSETSDICTEEKHDMANRDDSEMAMNKSQTTHSVGDENNDNIDIAFLETPERTKQKGSRVEDKNSEKDVDEEDVVKSSNSESLKNMDQVSEENGQILTTSLESNKNNDKVDIDTDEVDKDADEVTCVEETKQVEEEDEYVDIETVSECSHEEGATTLGKYFTSDDNKNLHQAESTKEVLYEDFIGNLRPCTVKIRRLSNETLTQYTYDACNGEKEKVDGHLGEHDSLRSSDSINDEDSSGCEKSKNLKRVLGDFTSDKESNCKPPKINKITEVILNEKSLQIPEKSRFRQGRVKKSQQISKSTATIKNQINDENTSKEMKRGSSAFVDLFQNSFEKYIGEIKPCSIRVEKLNNDSINKFSRKSCNDEVGVFKVPISPAPISAARRSHRAVSNKFANVPLENKHFHLSNLVTLSKRKTCSEINLNLGKVPVPENKTKRTPNFTHESANKLNVKLHVPECKTKNTRLSWSQKSATEVNVKVTSKLSAKQSRTNDKMAESHLNGRSKGNQISCGDSVINMKQCCIRIRRLSGDSIASFTGDAVIQRQTQKRPNASEKLEDSFAYVEYRRSGRKTGNKYSDYSKKDDTLSECGWKRPKQHLKSSETNGKEKSKNNIASNTGSSNIIISRKRPTRIENSDVSSKRARNSKYSSNAKKNENEDSLTDILKKCTIRVRRLSGDSLASLMNSGHCHIGENSNKKESVTRIEKSNVNGWNDVGNSPLSRSVNKICYSEVNLQRKSDEFDFRVPAVPRLTRSSRKVVNIQTGKGSVKNSSKKGKSGYKDWLDSESIDSFSCASSVKNCSVNLLRLDPESISNCPSVRVGEFKDTMPRRKANPALNVKNLDSVEHDELFCLQRFLHGAELPTKHLPQTEKTDKERKPVLKPKLKSCSVVLKPITHQPSMGTFKIKEVIRKHLADNVEFSSGSESENDEQDSPMDIDKLLVSLQDGEKKGSTEKCHTVHDLANGQNFTPIEKATKDDSEEGLQGMMDISELSGTNDINIQGLISEKSSTCLKEDACISNEVPVSENHEEEKNSERGDENVCTTDNNEHGNNKKVCELEKSGSESDIWDDDLPDLDNIQIDVTSVNKKSLEDVQKSKENKKDFPTGRGQENKDRLIDADEEMKSCSIKLIKMDEEDLQKYVSL